MKALVGAFNQEKALVGAFSVIVQPVVEPVDRFAALVLLLPAVLQLATVHRSPGPGRGYRQGHGEASRGPASLIFSVCVDELKCSDNPLTVRLEAKD